MSFSRTLVVAVLVALLATAFPPPFAAAGSVGSTARLSVAPDGAEADEDSYLSWATSVSDDGRYVAFTSFASNLVPGDTNGGADAFVADRLTGAVERVSVAADGNQANGPSGDPSLSADGRYVAFLSLANNLDARDRNFLLDVYVKDRVTGAVTLVSISESGAQGITDAATPAMSADGRFVAFMVRGIPPAPTSGPAVVYVHDRLTGETEWVSKDVTGGAPDGVVFEPAISGDGRYLSYYSWATDLVVGDVNNLQDLFYHDRATGETRLVSVTTDGTQANSVSGYAAVSRDGRYVAFQNLASNLLPGDSNGASDVYVWDARTGRHEVVSVSGAGALGFPDSYPPDISADGRFVTYYSTAGNIAPGATAFRALEYVHDRWTGATEMVSWGIDGGPANDHAYQPAISGDGTVVAYSSDATNLVATDAHGHEDVFAIRRGADLELRAASVALADPATLSVEGSAVRWGLLLTQAEDAPADATPGARQAGGEIVAARLAWRPADALLYARIDLATLPGGAGTVGLANIVYALQLTVDGTAYEARAWKDATGTRFGLFDCSSACVQTTALVGTLGAAGLDARMEIPFDALDARSGASITDLRAIARDADGILLLDELALPDALLPRAVATVGIAPASGGAPVLAAEIPLDRTSFVGAVDVSALSAGSYFATVRACDGARCGASASVPVTLVNSPPALETIDDVAASEGVALTLLVRATDPEGDALALDAAPLPPGATFADAGDGTGTLAWTPARDAAGEHVVTITARDGHARAARTFAIRVADVDRPPVLDAIGMKRVDEGALLAFAVHANDPDGDAIAYAAPALPSGATFDADTGAFRWAPTFAQAGAYTARFEATARGATVSEDVLIEVANVDRAPAFAPLADRSADVGRLLVVAVRATDADGDPIGLSAVQLPADATFEDLGGGEGTLAWTPALEDAGSHVVGLEAAANGVVTSVRFAIRVDPHPAISLAILGSPNALASPGETVPFRARVTNAGDVPDTIRFSVTGTTWEANLPSEVALATGAFAEVSFSLVVPAGGGSAAPRLVASSSVIPSVGASSAFRVDTPVVPTLLLDEEVYAPGEPIRGTLRGNYLNGAVAAGASARLLQRYEPNLGPLQTTLAGTLDATGVWRFDLSGDARPGLLGAHVLVASLTKGAQTRSTSEGYEVGAG